jgi:histidinol-phosphate/aromatic aminotransferase/cobyric acid decarboxylase-like protein
VCHPITATLYAYLYLVFIFFYDASKKEEQLSSAVDCNKRKKTRIEQQLTTHGIVSILSRSRTVTNFFVVSPLTAGVLKQEQRNSYKSVEIASVTFSLIALANDI